ncbi:MAG: uroporphyrinogen decarboxylase family protein [bacterium]|nr:uroporphyrinogen decarboxylase family protein [candidate division WOR-3 bacterium]MDH5682971.1 uroporphyrinogen decarboxylase family protein [candidate division WOR-3 bacterium]
MTEILNPRERFGLLVIDEKPDRCNIIPLITSHAATVAGIKLKEYYTDGEAMAKAQITAIEEYEHDAISIFSEVGIIAEAMGSEFNYPDDDLPVLRIPALTKFDIDKLKIPDPNKDSRLPVYLEAIEYAYSAVGDKIPILAYVPAPFTTGMMLSDPNQFLLDTIRNPEQIKKIIEISLEAAIEFSYEIINAGGLPILVDPLASGSVISPKAYQEFALPGEQGLIKFLHRYDFDVILHICGDTTPILDLLLLTGADLISLDKVELNLAIERLAPKMRIIGNFNTTKLGFGSPDGIASQVREMVKHGIKAEKGYIASTGCEVPIRAPTGNVKVFISAAKEAGWFLD